MSFHEKCINTENKEMTDHKLPRGTFFRTKMPSKIMSYKNTSPGHHFKTRTRSNAKETKPFVLTQASLSTHDDVPESPRRTFEVFNFDPTKTPPQAPKRPSKRERGETKDVIVEVGHATADRTAASFIDKVSRDADFIDIFECTNCGRQWDGFAQCCGGAMRVRWECGKSPESKE